MKENKVLAPLDTAWFDENPEKYFSRNDFIQFQEIAKVDLRNLISKNPEIVRATQKKLTKQSVVGNELQKQPLGYEFPFIVYTHSFKLFEKIPHHNPELDKIILALDMSDSLRRRHIALSHSIIPNAIKELSENQKHPIVIKNLGSGVGLDIINALQNTEGTVEKVLNYDTNAESIQLGREMTGFLENRNELRKGIIEYYEKDFIYSKEPADIIIRAGIICVLRNRLAKHLLTIDYKQLKSAGKLIVTSSNYHMRSTDPLSSFLIQHMGTRDNPYCGLGLNFRYKDTMYEILDKSGFTDIQIYDDANYPGKETLPEKLLNNVDSLPARVKGYHHDGFPLRIPSKEILDRGIGYNWIAIGTKK